MARTLICEIVTPEKRVFSGEGTMVVLPALDGELGVLPLHVPLVSALSSGEVRVNYEGDRKPERFAVAGGYVQVGNDKVIVLADVAAEAASIDVAEVKDRAEQLAERLKGAESGSAEHEQLSFDLNWCKTQLHVARQA